MSRILTTIYPNIEFDYQGTQSVFSFDKNHADFDTATEILESKNDDNQFKKIAIDIINDKLQISYKFKPDIKLLSDLRFNDFNRQQRLTIINNILKFHQNYQLINSKIAIFEPNNILIAPDLEIDLQHFGLLKFLEPREPINQIDNIKSLIIALTSDNSFNNIESSFQKNLKGLVRSKNIFVNKINKTESIESIRAIVSSEYRKVAIDYRKNKKLVNRSFFYLIRNSLLILIIGSVILGLLFGQFYQSTTVKNTVIAAQNAYIKKDYRRTKEKLIDTNFESLDTNAKYMLADANVRLENFNSDQRQDILNGLSDKTPSNILLFWINSGYGKLNKALDYAKKINDPQLLLFIYKKLYNQTKNNSKISGAIKQNKLQQFQTEIDKLNSILKEVTKS